MGMMKKGEIASQASKGWWASSGISNGDSCSETRTFQNVSLWYALAPGPPPTSIAADRAADRKGHCFLTHVRSHLTLEPAIHVAAIHTQYRKDKAPFDYRCYV
uniref:Uncharacterized protein n=2 Tax=Picea TaxID=3328 RepID=A0A124GMY0_PICGL|nr:hypothetical protein ABT39_MTgene6083 [Picea glauca]QHR89959.1 hypothetical protein Q903MT_gene3981 [Picea sitchensis]